jgi:sulfur carrier protein ThiS
LSFDCRNVTIEIKIFGFGDDRPTSFLGKNQLKLELATPATPWEVLRAAGIDDATGMVMMISDEVVPSQQWDDSIINEESQLTVLSAFEGG